MAIRNTRLLVLPLISLFLLLISFALLSYWGYQIFYRSKNEKRPGVQKDSANSSEGSRDSLQKIYSAAISNLDHPEIAMSSLPPDSTDTSHVIKPEDFYKLRNEITDLLKNPASNGDLEIARQKIVELQDKIQLLHTRNESVELENKKLSAALTQLSKKKSIEEIRTPASTLKTRETLPITVSDLHLAAINVGQNSEVETTLAEQTVKLIGYFVAKNNNTYNNGEIFVVVTQPDGHIMQNSPWEAGSFQTSNGRKSYSCKMSFDGFKKEGTRLQFTLNAENFEKGNYSVVIYNNGIVVKKIIKSLL
ncbi:MAG: hypothetical protein ABJA57_08350 [Ginsengibacter sp.]